jgi:hypothetical protein
VRKAVFKTLAVYKSKPFARFARKARIPDADLWEAARLANEGVIDADLGGGIIKQRIARAGQGKSGGSRSIILFRKNDRPSMSTALKRRIRPTSGQTNLKPSANMRKFISATQMPRWRN